MRIYGVMAIAVLLVACGVIHPFGDKTGHLHVLFS